MTETMILDLSLPKGKIAAAGMEREAALPATPKKRQLPELEPLDQPLDLSLGDKKDVFTPPTTPTTPSGAWAYKKSILKRYMTVDACEKPNQKNSRESAAEVLLNLPSPSHTTETRAYLQSIIQNHKSQPVSLPPSPMSPADSGVSVSDQEIPDDQFVKAKPSQVSICPTSSTSMTLGSRLAFPPVMTTGSPGQQNLPHYASAPLSTLPCPSSPQAQPSHKVPHQMELKPQIKPEPGNIPCSPTVSVSTSNSLGLTLDERSPPGLTPIYTAAAHFSPNMAPFLSRPPTLAQTPFLPQLHPAMLGASAPGMLPQSVVLHGSQPWQDSDEEDMDSYDGSSELTQQELIDIGEYSPQRNGDFSLLHHSDYPAQNTGEYVQQHSPTKKKKVPTATLR